MTNNNKLMVLCGFVAAFNLTGYYADGGQINVVIFFASFTAMFWFALKD